MIVSTYQFHSPSRGQILPGWNAPPTAESNPEPEIDGGSAFTRPGTDCVATEGITATPRMKAEAIKRVGSLAPVAGEGRAPPRRWKSVRLLGHGRCGKVSSRLVVVVG